MVSGDSRGGDGDEHQPVDLGAPDEKDQPER
jgi:hypothetical protein